MPHYIKKDFEPNEKTFKALQANGIVQAFLDEYVTEHFIEFWNELKDDHNHKGQKTAWQTTYRGWARRAFKGKLGRLYEERRHQRSVYGKAKPNLFQETLGGMIAEGSSRPPKKKPSYRLPDPPPDTGERMSVDEAVEKLGKMFQSKS
jgi:hypothetical protein